MFKKWFCKHEWMVFIEFFQPPMKDIVSRGFSCSENLSKTLIYGKTNVMFACVKCGTRDEKEYFGEQK